MGFARFVNAFVAGLGLSLGSPAWANGSQGQNAQSSSGTISIAVSVRAAPFTSKKPIVSERMGSTCHALHEKEGSQLTVVPIIERRANPATCAYSVQAPSSEVGRLRGVRYAIITPL